MEHFEFEQTLRGTIARDLDAIPIPNASFSELRARADALGKAKAASAKHLRRGTLLGAFWVLGFCAVAAAAFHAFTITLRAPDGSIEPPPLDHLVTMEQAARDADFPVVAPSGLPQGTRLVKIHEVRLPKGPRTLSIFFDYVARGRIFVVVETRDRGNAFAQSRSRWPSGRPLPRLDLPENGRISAKLPPLPAHPPRPLDTWTVGATRVSLLHTSSMRRAEVEHIRSAMSQRESGVAPPASPW